jgi:large subunit ribosomal protein L10
VKQQQTLRRGLRAGGAEFKVVKMTLARLAAAELELVDLDELFLGPTGIAFADGDPVTAAKALQEFAKENEAFAVKGGLLGREFLSPERISALAEIESREVLLSQIAGAMQAPMAKLAGLLAALPRNMASAIQQLVEKKEEAEGDEAPAAKAEPPEEGLQETAEEGLTGEAVAAEDSAEGSVAAATDEIEAPVADAEGSEEPVTETQSDGDDAKSVDKDPAEEAEEA